MTDIDDNGLRDSDEARQAQQDQGVAVDVRLIVVLHPDIPVLLPLMSLSSRLPLEASTILKVCTIIPSDQLTFEVGSYYATQAGFKFCCPVSISK